MNDEMTHVLGCKRTTEVTPLKDIFDLCRNTHTRLRTKKKKKKSTKHSLVLPYAILTDGHDMIMSVNGYGQFMLGTTSLVDAKKIVWTKRQFDELVEKTVIEDTLSRFAGMTIEDEHGETRQATADDFKVVCTERATRSIDFFQVYPFYMVMMKDPTRKCSIPSMLADGSETLPIEVLDFLRMGLAPRLQFPCRAALQMFFHGEIELPERVKGFV